MEHFDQWIKRDDQGYRFHQEQTVEADLDGVFEFFSDPHNLEALTPDRMQFNILECDPYPISGGTEIDYNLKIWGFPVRWTSKITRWEPPNKFRDVMLRGPYKTWKHTHEFERQGSNTVLIDDVYYELPLGLPGRLTAGWAVNRDLKSIFKHRADQMEDVF